MKTEEINEITGAIIDCSIQIHRAIGPGLLEVVYRRILAHELDKQGFQVVTERAIPMEWDGVNLGTGFYADIIVNQTVLIELKAVESLHPVHHSQTLTYLTIAKLPVGLLINFNSVRLIDGLRRIVNNLSE